MADTVRTETGQPSLKRVMGPGLLLLFIVGEIGRASCRERV